MRRTNFRIEIIELWWDVSDFTSVQSLPKVSDGFLVLLDEFACYDWFLKVRIGRCAAPRMQRVTVWQLKTLRLATIYKHIVFILALLLSVKQWIWGLWCVVFLRSGCSLIYIEPSFWRGQQDARQSTRWLTLRDWSLGWLSAQYYDWNLEPSGNFHPDHLDKQIRRCRIRRARLETCCGKSIL